MNIVYLIGNGFDLNLGMRTRYCDFFKYYTNLPKDDADVVERLKEEIKGNVEDWSDFEFKLGEFLNEKVDSKDALYLYDHLLVHLSKYIKKEEDECIFDNIQKDIFYEYLSKPYTENRLFPDESKVMDKYLSDFGRNDWCVKIITFNYTKSIETLLGSSIDENTPIGTNCFSHKVILSEIEHIHGFANDRITFGVNDATQIANEKLRADKRVTNRYVKSDYNKKCRLGHDEKCRQWISNANLICLFGLSFGDTDKKWWNMMSNVLRYGKVIIFEYWPGDLPDKIHTIDTYELEEKVKDKFLSKTDISENSKDDIKENMYVAFNKDMFNFGKLKRRVETNSESV